MATATSDLWAALLSDLIGSGLVSFGYSEGDVQGLFQSKLILGEITGPSDGLVFTTSALREEALTARGAVVVEARTADLSHLDLLYASPITGALLIAQAEADPVEDGWKAGVGARYVEADTIGWVRTVLADDPVEDTGGDTGGGDSGGDDTGDPQETGDPDDSATPEDSDPAADSGEGEPKRACSTAPGGAGGPALALGILAAARRRRS